MKIKYSLLSLFLLLTLFSSAQDTTRILFIGNSFTYGSNMPQMVKAFGDSADLHIITAMHAPGGISVGDTAQGNQAHWKNPALFQLIRSQKWDFAVIQDNQGRFILDSAVFPGKSKVVQGHLNIMDSVKKNNSCAKIILFGGWAWKFGMPPYGNTGVEIIERILVNYCVLNDTMKEVVAPIGEAWIKASTYLPSVNLWDVDDAHPSYAGSYLTASVIFSTIFDLPAKPVSYNGMLAPATADTLRMFADSCVFGTVFHSRYNLGGVKLLSPVAANGQLSLPGTFASYKWYKNNAFLANTAVLNSPENGVYRAEVIENDGCIIKTCSYKYTEPVNTTGLSERDLAGIEVFPNPVTDSKLIVRSDKDLQRVELLGISGTHEKISLERRSGEIHISTKGLKPGYYTLQLTTNKNAIHKKILICE